MFRKFSAALALKIKEKPYYLRKCNIAKPISIHFHTVFFPGISFGMNDYLNDYFHTIKRLIRS